MRARRRRAASLFTLAAQLILLQALEVSAQAPREYARGVAAFLSKDYRSAADWFQKAEAASPGVTDALVYEAKALIHVQEFTLAEKALQKYLAIHSDSHEALYLLGFVLHRENRPSESLEVFTKAAALKTPTGDDLKIVGLDYVLLNNYADAIKWLEKAVQFDPGNKEAWYYLGRAYYSDSRPAQAKTAFLTVLELDPHDVRAENNLGLVFEAEARTNDALEAYRKAIAWQQGSPRPSEQPYLNLGILLLEQERVEEAVGALEKGTELAPNDATCHFRLGIAYSHMNRLQEAQAELARAELLEPQNARIHYQLGRVYKQMHQMDRAKAEFARTEELQNGAAGALPRQVPVKPQ